MKNSPSTLQKIGKQLLWTLLAVLVVIGILVVVHLLTPDSDIAKFTYDGF